MMKAVIFDLDGLLADTEPISYQLYCDLVAKYGHTFALNTYAQHYSGKTGVGNMHRLIATYQLPLTLSEGLSWVDERESTYFHRGVSLKSGARELLLYLRERHVLCVLASSSTRQRAMAILDQNNITSFFDQMLFGSEVPQGKPHPDIFLKACEKAGVTCDEALVLEDSEAGILSASEAGITVICVPDMKRPQDEVLKKAAAVFGTLEDVIGYLEERA